MRRRFEEEDLLHEAGFEPAPDDGAELWVRREEGDGVSVLFALVTSLCAAVLAVLFVTMWLDGDGVTTTALAVALLPMVVLTMLAWGEAL